MKRILFALLLGSISFLGLQAQEPPKFKTGAKRTPVPKIAEAISAGKVGVHRAPLAASIPTQVMMIPARLSMWGNSQYGMCVTTESCFAMAAYSTYVKAPEVFITEATAINWARDHGVLNGATLLEVIEGMQKDGIKDENGILRKEGKSSVVDYTDEDTLKSALAIGPVSIAIDSNSLPSDAGSRNGWNAFNVGNFSNTDHDVGLAGYGSTVVLAQALGVTPPANAPPTSYLVFTWNSIGMVSHGWIKSTVAEAWLRTPTIVGMGPSPEPPPPPPPPPPVTPGKFVVTSETVTVPLGLVPGSYTPVPDGILQMRLGDLLNPSPALSPAERQLLERLLDRLKTQK